MSLVRIIILFSLLLSSHQAIAKANYKFYNEPHWIHDKKPNLSQKIPVERVKDGRHYLLVDNQIRVSKKGDVASYHHYAEYIVNQNGIENSSQISIDFNPAYQNLFVYKLQVWRKGKSIDKRKTARITLIQPESQAKDLIYNGEKSLNIILDDIRVGDTIEYSYSRYGSNPVFDGVFDTERRLQWNIPVGEIYQRIIWNKTTPLYFKRENTNIKVKQVHHGSETEFIIETKNIPAISLDENTPSWFSPYAHVYFSEIQNWQGVVKWGERLFSSAKKTSPSIRKVANKIKNEHSDKLKQIAVALQYVQANVRYLGLELGENSHRPTSPDVTLKRRYGDCKDKSVLYIALLRELGVTAYPVLVNTKQRHQIHKRLPAYGAFNHVIVKVIHDGEYYWFDPTRQYQLGAPNDVYQPDYGYGLVLKLGSNKLESMQTLNKAVNLIINEQFHVDIKKRDKVKYEIATTYYGLDAEYQRDRIASKGVQKVQKSYLDFYKYFYPNIKMVKTAVFSDKPVNGELLGYEEYNIPDFWEDDKKDNIFIGNFYASSISSYLNQPKLKTREHPYHLSYPLSIEQNIKVNFSHDDWGFKKVSYIEDNDFFHYKSTAFYDKEKKQLKLKYDFKTKTNTVPAKYYKEYIAALKRVSKDVDYSIEYSAVKTSLINEKQTVGDWIAKNGWIIGISVYVLLIILGIVLWILADKKHPTSAETLYYPVSVPKFLLMWIMTLGAYGLYWFYKNYAYIKRRDGTSIMPIARGIFNLFWYYPVYKDLTRHKENSSVKATMPPLFVGGVFAVFFFIANLLSNRGDNFVLISFILSGLLIVPMVNYIYHINDKNSEDSRYNSKLSPRHLVLSFIFLPLLLVIIGSDTGLTAKDSVILGDKLYNHDLKYMQRKGIIKPGDKINYFYSDAFMFIRDDGNGFTERHVFSYWKEDGKLYIETASYNEIKDISITWSESFIDDTIVKIIRKDKSEFLLYVAKTNKKDKTFGRELKKRWQNIIKG